jgi:hypothetical protein
LVTGNQIASEFTATWSGHSDHRDGRETSSGRRRNNGRLDPDVGHRLLPRSEMNRATFKRCAAQKTSNGIVLLLRSRTRPRYKCLCDLIADLFDDAFVIVIKTACRR